MTAAMASARGRSGDGILRTAARGAALIGVAVVIGIVLLQVVDKGSPVGGGSGPVTPTTSGSSHGSTTTTQAGNVRPPQQVSVAVLNGGGVAGAAATNANKLRGLGYPIALVGNAPAQTGATIACKQGYEKEGAALAKSLGITTPVAAIPNPAPTGAENAACIVTIGK